MSNEDADKEALAELDQHMKDLDDVIAEHDRDQASLATLPQGVTIERRMALLERAQWQDRRLILMLMRTALGQTRVNVGTVQMTERHEELAEMVKLIMRSKSIGQA